MYGYTVWTHSIYCMLPFRFNRFVFALFQQFISNLSSLTKTQFSLNLYETLKMSIERRRGVSMFIQAINLIFDRTKVMHFSRDKVQWSIDGDSFSHSYLYTIAGWQNIMSKLGGRISDKNVDLTWFKATSHRRIIIE